MSDAELHKLGVYLWEIRTRGIHVYESHVELEPTFVPYIRYPEFLLRESTQTRWERFRGIRKEHVLDEEKVKQIYGQDPVFDTNELSSVTYEIVLPNTLICTRIQALQLTEYISQTSIPVTLDIVATATRIQFFLTTYVFHSDVLMERIKVLFPNIIINETHKTLHQYIPEKDSYIEAMDFALGYESVLPLRSQQGTNINSLDGLYALFETLTGIDVIIFQVMTTGVVNLWKPHLYNLSHTSDGKPVFPQSPEFTRGADEKLKDNLTATVIRSVCIGKTLERRKQLLDYIEETICTSTHGIYNSLKRTPRGEIHHTHHWEDVLNRKTRRTGMILNHSGLALFFNFPSSYLRKGKLNIHLKKSVKPPKELSVSGVSIGINEHYGEETIISVSKETRLRHTHIIGATGTGKSTLLLSLMIQDAQNGNGFTLLDPHGDLIEHIISHLPKERHDDVILIDPNDTDFPLGINLLHAKTEIQKIVLSSDLTGLFRRFSTSWGDQMEAILSNAINVLLESKEEYTLADLRTFLVNKEMRKTVLDTIEDEYLLQFWNTEFQLLRGNAIASIITRLDAFMRPKVIRGMMSQKKGISFKDIIDSSKILLVKLPQGLIGKSNSFLLGSLIVSKLYQYAQERTTTRIPHYLYIDEFQNFVTPSMENLLSGARKFGFGLVLAHQELEQLRKGDNTLYSSLLSNAGTQIVFRVSPKDASVLEKGFHDFDMNDFQNLGIGEAIIRIERSHWNCNIVTPHIKSEPNEEIYSYILNRSRELHTKEQTKNIHTLIEIEEEQKPLQKEVEEIVTLLPPQPIQVHENKERNYDKEIDDLKERERKKYEKRQHRIVQETIVNIGKRYNWGAYIEHKVENPNGYIDVALHIGEIKVAVEISVTNSIDYEVKNIQKCLSNGYDVVFMCCENATHLYNIKERFEKSQDKELPNVLFGNLNTLDTLLHQIHLEQKPKEKTIGGYKVKVRFRKSDGGSRDEILKSLFKRKS